MDIVNGLLTIFVKMGVNFWIGLVALIEAYMLRELIKRNQSLQDSTIARHIAVLDVLNANTVSNTNLKEAIYASRMLNEENIRFVKSALESSSANRDAIGELKEMIKCMPEELSKITVTPPTSRRKA